MTHAVGVGMQRAVPEAELERMEAFFRDRNSACLLDLCPMVDNTVLAFVQSRPYRFLECNNVLARGILPDENFPVQERIRETEPGEEDLFARLVLRGFSEYMPYSEEIVAAMTSTLGASRSWIAIDSEPEAGAAMGIRSGVALLYGDATLVGGRRKGWQSGLIQSRLRAAQREGCDLAIVSVLPGSASHRNYERAGFQLIYTRMNLTREF